MVAGVVNHNAFAWCRAEIGNQVWDGERGLCASGEVIERATGRERVRKVRDEEGFGGARDEDQGDVAVRLLEGCELREEDGTDTADT